MKFDIIVADPPWGFSDTLKRMKAKTKRSAFMQYPTMSPSQVAALPINNIANPSGCLLALWVPCSMLVHGLQVMDAWGFKQKQVFVWVKIKKNHKQESDWNDGTSVGMGRLFRQSHEIALIGTLGSVYTHLNDRSQRSVAFDLNVAHSVKPPTLQDRLELMFPNALRLEVFARRVRPSWTCVGNAIDGKDVTIALNDLITL